MSHPTGFTGDGHNCDNINECEIHGQESEPRHGCDSNAQCTDSPGSYSCICDSGFTGDGVDCDGVWNIANTHWKSIINTKWFFWQGIRIKGYSIFSSVFVCNFEIKTVHDEQPLPVKKMFTPHKQVRRQQVLNKLCSKLCMEQSHFDISEYTLFITTILQLW